MKIEGIQPGGVIMRRFCAFGCESSGIIATETGDLPCACSLGEKARFNIRCTGAELRLLLEHIDGRRSGLTLTK